MKKHIKNISDYPEADVVGDKLCRDMHLVWKKGRERGIIYHIISLEGSCYSVLVTP